MHPDQEGLHLYTLAQTVARAQALARRYVPEERDMSGELIDVFRPRL